jgi:hypothetical protein
MPFEMIELPVFEDIEQTLQACIGTIDKQSSIVSPKTVDKLTILSILN